MVEKTLSAQIGRLEDEIKKLSWQSDQASARQWRQKRAELAKAQYALFLKLEKSQPLFAIQMLYRAAMLDNSKAVDRLWRNRPTQSIVGPKEIQEQAASADMQFLRGLQALTGIGLSPNDQLSFEYIQLAAQQKHARAQNHLGEMYQYGRGVARDDGLAVYWYRLAAEQGLAAAQSYLRLMYENGRINVQPNDAIDYRKDIQLRGVSRAKNALEICADQNVFAAQYHLAMVNGVSGAIQDILKTRPNEFFKELLLDNLLDTKTHYFWIEKLFEEQHRSKVLAGSKSSYKNRSKLTEDNMMTLSMVVAKHRYAHLATSNLPESEERQKNKEYEINLEQERQRQQKEIPSLMDILDTLSKGHAGYTEAQLILAHLQFMLDKKNPKWLQHFQACEEADVEKKWVGRQLIPERIIQIYLEALKKDDSEEIKKLYQVNFKQMAENKKSVEPLLRLSIMAKDVDPDKYDHCMTAFNRNECIN